MAATYVRKLLQNRKHYKTSHKTQEADSSSNASGLNSGASQFESRSETEYCTTVLGFPQSPEGHGLR
jgi:hypothetical protein